jgi:hypothetical protein
MSYPTGGLVCGVSRRTVKKLRLLVFRENIGVKRYSEPLAARERPEALSNCHIAVTLPPATIPGTCVTGPLPMRASEIASFSAEQQSEWGSIHQWNAYESPLSLTATYFLGTDIMRKQGT